jgi:hypothetical protein
VAHLIAAERVAPSDILCITFTNKAANELKTRLSELLPHGAHKYLTVRARPLAPSPLRHLCEARQSLSGPKAVRSCMLYGHVRTPAVPLSVRHLPLELLHLLRSISFMIGATCGLGLIRAEVKVRVTCGGAGSLQRPPSPPALPP